MALYVSEEWLRAYCQRTGQKMPDVQTNPSHDLERGTVLIDRDPLDGKTKARTKYGNQRTMLDGRSFASKHEARVYEEFKLQVRAGIYRAVMCQVPFLLPGDVRYIADFVTLNNNGTYTVYDAKSEATQRDKIYRLKKKQLKACCGIEIQEV